MNNINRKENIMEESELKEIFFNRADIEKAEKVACDNCFEHMVFMLRDSQQHEFSVGITTVLECLAFAISTGDLPKLPLSWLDDVDQVYNTAFSDNEDISYYDDETYKERYKQK